VPAARLNLVAGRWEHRPQARSDSARGPGPAAAGTSFTLLRKQSRRNRSLRSRPLLAAGDPRLENMTATLGGVYSEQIDQFQCADQCGSGYANGGLIQDGVSTARITLECGGNYPPGSTTNVILPPHSSFPSLTRHVMVG
jgi:hypothetical protein